MAELQIHDIEAPLGALVEGLDTTAELDEEACRLLRRAFDDRGLLLFRSVDVDPPFQMRLSEMLIGKDSRPTQGAESTPALDNFYISNKKEGAAAPFGRLPFHSDAMWSDDPPRVISLYAVQIEPPVVPTIFASSVRAWEALPDDLRARVEKLNALHIAGAIKRGDEPEEVLESTFERPPSTVTPVGHRHPRTGRTLLYICQQMTQEIVGMTPQESEDLLAELFAHLYHPVNRWEHEWRNRDLVVWDNLAVQHGRVNVLAKGPARTLRKFFSPIPSLGSDQMPKYSSAQR
jgi:alpha-ketoglutarate-dependent taurine dioxygenase